MNKSIMAILLFGFMACQPSPTENPSVQIKPYLQKFQQSYTLGDPAAPISVDALIQAADEVVWAFADGRVFKFGDGEWNEIAELRSAPEPILRQALQRVARKDAEFTAPSGKVWRVADPGLTVGEADGSTTPVDGLPIEQVDFITGHGERIWCGTGEGALLFDGSRWHYFASRRWLPDDQVTDILAASDSVTWIATKRGISRIAFRPYTLRQKTMAFEQRVKDRHWRHGLVSDASLRRFGDLTSFVMHDNDNDGLWTSLYLAAESFRFAVTGSADARQNAIDAFHAMEKLETFTGTPGFFARSYVHVTEADMSKAPGEWHLSADGKWWWKGDTSSDEAVGHFFAYPIYCDLIDDPDEKSRAREVARRIMDHIIDSGYYLIDVDGMPTRWGVWSPDSLNHPNWMIERGLNSLQLLSFLKCVYHMTGDQKYQREYRKLIEEHGYAGSTVEQKITIPGEVNHSDDELAFLPYYGLFKYEDDPELLAIYRKSMERSWEIEAPERNPLWNIIATSALGRDCGLADAVQTLQRIPMDLIDWPVKNSHRADIKIDAQADRFGKIQSHVVLPFDERPMMKWNGNPYLLDGGSGHNEEDGAFYLLPYWMGLHHGFFVEEAARHQ